MYNSYVNQKRDGSPSDLFVILHAAHAAEAEVEARLSEIGLSLAKLAALNALSESGESMPLGQLAEKLACVKSNITQLVDRLEADGLVARKHDPNDRRARLAALTAAGRKACQEGGRIQIEAERHLLKRLSRDEMERLTALLAKVGSTGG
jgi:DNA-binding MarR family transcriptional regulator